MQKNIWINFEWKGAETWLSIKDDGSGMDNEETHTGNASGKQKSFGRQKAAKTSADSDSVLKNSIIFLRQES
jgi:hypothetical protein